MRTRTLIYKLCALAAVIALAALQTGGTHAASTAVVLHSFDDFDGAYPSTDLVRDAGGNLYGMTVLGGDFGSGTVFQLAPSGSGWTETVLHSFTSGADGGQPYGGVTLDAQGNVFGTTVIGGSGGVCVESGCGVVFKLTRTGSTWSPSVIYDFTGLDDGYGPGGPVVFDAQGNLYGMTPTGGANGLGVVYKLTPGAGGAWTQSVIHTFTGGSDGATGSAGRLLVDNATGAITGVATVGGQYGAGVVFRLTSTASGPWTPTTLYEFQGQPDAAFPYGGLLKDTAGNLYGTTYYGGANGLGAVYKLTSQGGAYTESVLHSFRGGRDGANSISNLVFGRAGNLFGTTSEGGAAGCGCGTVFRLAPKANGTWGERVVHRFEGVPDGAYAYSGLLVDAAGNLYGATVHGGDDDDGAVFQITP